MAFTPEQLKIIRDGFGPAFPTKDLLISGYRQVLRTLLIDLAFSLRSSKDTTASDIQTYCTAILQELKNKLNIGDAILEMNSTYALLLINDIAELVERRFIEINKEIQQTSKIKLIIESGIEALSPDYLSDEYIALIHSLFSQKFPAEKLKTIGNKNKAILHIAQDILEIFDLFKLSNRTDFHERINEDLCILMLDLIKCEYPHEDPETVILILELTSEKGLRVKFDRALIVDLATLPDKAKTITLGEIKTILDC